MSVRRCKKETSSSDFVKWMVFLNEHSDRSDYYLAQIAAEVRRTVAKRPQQVKLEHFLITFIRRQAEGTMTREEQTAWSKACWFAAAGYNPRTDKFNKKMSKPSLPSKVRAATAKYNKKTSTNGSDRT